MQDRDILSFLDEFIRLANELHLLFIWCFDRSHLLVWLLLFALIGLIATTTSEIALPIGLSAIRGGVVRLSLLANISGHSIYRIGFDLLVTRHLLLVTGMHWIWICLDLLLWVMVATGVSCSALDNTAEYIRIGLLKLTEYFGTMLRQTKTAFKQLYFL